MAYKVLYFHGTSVKLASFSNFGCLCRLVHTLAITMGSAAQLHCATKHVAGGTG